MRLWMHGIGADIPASVRKLKSLGFEAVVGSVPALIRAANEAGLDVYLCSGAFGASGPFAEARYLARDISGQPRVWFGSACPNQPDVRAANLESIARMAQTEGIRGILIDGARFASPASSSDPDTFFTCFCPVCAAKAEQLGYDFSSMRESVRVLRQHLSGLSAPPLLDHLPGLAAWLSFRRQCVTEHLLHFCGTVKGVNPDLLSGIYIFTPALAALVGQCYEDLQGKMDLFAPMIYRHYRAPEGPACLNHELSALANMLSARFLPPSSAVRLMASLTGLALDGFNSAADLLNGLPPEAVGSEVRRARERLGADSALIPILQLDDPLLGESIQHPRQAGADGVNFFHYDDHWLDQARPVLEQLSND